MVVLKRAPHLTGDGLLIASDHPPCASTYPTAEKLVEHDTQEHKRLEEVMKQPKRCRRPNLDSTRSCVS